jgi:hypothetical protein
MSIGLPATALPLIKAIEAYGDRALREAWLEKDRHLNTAGGRKFIAEGTFWSNGERGDRMRHGLVFLMHRAKAEDAYIKAFWHKVVSGELLVWGRSTPAAPLVPVDAAFRYLTPDFQADTIRGEFGFAIYDIRIAPKEALQVAMSDTKHCVPQASIVQAIQQKIASWRRDIEPKPRKTEVYEWLCSMLGNVSKRQFLQHWAVLVPDDWKRAGAPRRAKSNPAE